MVDTVADADDIAAALEDAIYSEFKSTETKYKNRIRSRIANLKVHHSVLIALLCCVLQSTAERM